MAAHRYAYKKWCENIDGSKYTSSFEILKYQNATIELIEAFPCRCKDELNRREGEIIKATVDCVNRQIAGQSRKEYDDSIKEHVNEVRRMRYGLKKHYCFLD